MPPPHVGMITGSKAELQGMSGPFRGVGVGEGAVNSQRPLYKETQQKAKSWPGHAN